MSLTKIALVEYVASGATLTPEIRKELADELRKLYRVEEAWETWQEKTDWIQNDARPGELGMHRADALKARLDKWESAGLSKSERKMLLTWYGAVQDLNPTFLDGADRRLAERITKSIKEDA